MAVNLRSVTGELHQKLKVRAVQEGVTIESLCVRFLWWGLHHMDEVGGDSSVAEQRSSSPLVAGPSPALRSTTHDPKTCNVYKCGMCAALRGDR